MLLNRSITYRLYPNKAQEAKLNDTLRLHCDLYNAALEERIKAYKISGKFLSYFDQQKELPELKQVFPEYRNINAQSLQENLRKLDRAYKSFFRRVSKGETPGFPRFKSLQRFSGWSYTQTGWKLLDSKLNLTGIGAIKFRGKSKYTNPKTLTISRKNNKWYACLTYECEPKRSKGTSKIGLDWGLQTFVTTIDTFGNTNKIKQPKELKKSLKKLKVLQQSLSRKKKGSNNRFKAKFKVSNLYNKITNKRKDFLHKTSSKIISEVSLIATEKLNSQNLLDIGTKSLSRNIGDSSPGTFIQMLKYKAEEAGVEFIEVPTKQVKPSQTCSSCGKQEKKDLTVRLHKCDCGLTLCRDINAAKVMLNWALKSQGMALCGV